MRVAGAGEVLGGGAEFHRDADLVDQVARRGPDDVAAEDAVGFLVGQQLDEAVPREVGLGAAVAHERELADLVGAALGLELFFRLADVGDLGVGVDHARDHVVVHVARLPGDDLGHGDAFVLGLVGQHRPLDHVADGVEALDVGGIVAVDRDLAALGHGHAERVEAEALGVGFAAGGDEDDVGVEAGLAVVLAQLPGHLCARLAGLDLLDGRAENEVKALLLQDFLEGLGGLAVKARGDAVHEFDDGHLGPEAGIDRAQFEADHAAADDDHAAGDLRQAERAGRGDDDLLVDGHFRPRDCGGFAARGQDDVPGLVDLVADLDLAGLRDRAPALEPGDLVLLEQELDALGVLADDVVLVGQHLVPVDRHLGAHEAHFLKVFMGFVQRVAGVQQRLRGDATDVQAGAAERVAAFDNGGLQSQLGAADGADIAPRTGADDDDVEVCHEVVPLILRRRYRVGLTSVSRRYCSAASARS